jgi:hypothetical protein
MFMLACCLSELLSISEQDYGKHTQASIKLTKHPSKTNILPTLSLVCTVSKQMVIA